MNKKLIATSSLLSSLILGMGIAHAAPPSAELTVIGTLTVPTCTVAAADDGTYDIGKISASLVKPSANMPLSPISKTWTITCDADTYLNFKPLDNRSATASTTGTTNFGLGLVNETGKIGFYTVTMKNASVDGSDSSVFSSASTTVSSSSSVVVNSANRNGWSTGALQKSGKLFVADLEVAPTLASSVVMNGPVTDDADIDGSLTLNFAYGI